MVTIEEDMDGNAETTDHGIRVNDTVIIANANWSSQSASCYSCC
jgi:hypothetical protein